MLTLFALSYAGLGISMYPYIVPQSITIWHAASPENSQIFMLFGVAVLIPLILGYTAWAYWVFRGKVQGRKAAIIDAGQQGVRGRSGSACCGLWRCGSAASALCCWSPTCLRLWIAPK